MFQYNNYNNKYNTIIEYAEQLEYNKDYYNCYQLYIKALEYAFDDQKKYCVDKIFLLIIEYAKQLQHNRDYWFSYEEYIKALTYISEEQEILDTNQLSKQNIIEQSFDILKMYIKELEDRCNEHDVLEFINIVKEFTLDSFTKEILTSIK